MKIKITVKYVNGESYGGVRYGKSFTFDCDPVEMARYRTASTVKRRIDEYVAKSGIFSDVEMKHLVYDMEEFNTAWKEEVRILKKKEKEEEEEINKKVEEIKKKAERYQLFVLSEMLKKIMLKNKEERYQQA